MKLAELANSSFARAIEESRLIVSVQAGEGSPLEDPETLVRCAKASLQEGVKVLRAEGVRNISAIKRATGAMVIGLIKRKYSDSDVYITPTMREVRELLDTDCEAIAVDATQRKRPGGEALGALVAAIQGAGRLLVADVDSADAAESALNLGVDFVSTTLAGYTDRLTPNGPDIELVRRCNRAFYDRMLVELPELPRLPPEIKRLVDRSNSLRSAKAGLSEPRILAENQVPRASDEWMKVADEVLGKILAAYCPVLLAEGRFAQRWEVDAALIAGATAVVVGGAINDPVKNTRRLMPTKPPQTPLIAAFDIGGTWIRAAEFTRSRIASPIEKIPLPPTRKEKMEWMANYLKEGEYSRVGISTGGVVKDNVVTISKPTLPENVGTDFNDLREFLTGDDPIGVIALDDGHASAWGHACHPDFSGLNVATLAIGTGVGFGFVREGKIFMGRGGEYTRINDLDCPEGRTYEELLGGSALSPKPTGQQKADANIAVRNALRMVTTFLFPDVIVLCGTVGMQTWLDLRLPPKEGFPEVPIVRSPFGADAGIYGSAAVALHPPLGLGR